MRGRKKLPAAIVKLMGNPARRPINNKEPQLEQGIPDRSLFHLNKMAKRHWKIIAPQLEQQGILAKLDGGILAAYCTACARLYYAEKAISEEGEYQLLDGVKKRHPAVLTAKEARDQIRSLAAELGLTAISRARLKTVEKTKEDPFEAYRNQKQRA